MDSQVSMDGFLVDLVDDNWRADTLPQDDIDVPTYELPDPEADNGDVNLTLKEQEQKWTDIALSTISEHHPDCTAVQTQDVQIAINTEADYTCSYPSCKNKSYVPLICEKCNKHFCVEHRHIINCNEKTAEEVAAELEKFTAPVKQFNETKLQIDKQLNETISQARKKPKTQKVANKIQLMRIKNKATGLKTIPTADRIYFNVQHPKEVGNKVSPVFVSKTWTLGRVIDAIAEECKASNKNNISNCPKLRLFHKSGEILSPVLSNKLETLLSDQEVIDGEDLILEYVDNNCTNLNNTQ
ncbi:hypothetical protein ILUMI_26610 [Ignelater luminosus]|uniref:Anaphase-promoting complex subunit 13 n=1 Tax=Ignelater luminosus TaxID=2038154 RepID=A0A8K0C6F8_IGNLU|nr:hypothetical protein ILUMI_26610 [Ignelater luminosus]